MKICFITPFFDPWNVGGAEKYANMLVHELIKRHQVIVITTRGPTTRKLNNTNHNLKIIEISPLNVYSLYRASQNESSILSLKQLLWHIFSLWNFSAFIQIKKILDHEKPDIIHTNGIKGLSASVFSVIGRSKIPHVHTVHDYELISMWVNLYRNGELISKFNLLDKLFMKFMQKMSSHIDSIISPSQFVMDLHLKFGFFKNSKKFVIPHGVILNDNINPKTKFTNEFLFVGRITEDKGIQIAVDTFKKIKNTNAKLHVVGKGPFFNSLKNQVGENKNIMLHGFVQDNELDDIFKKCSFSIIPSLWYEVFGYTVIEAMSKGMPVIASKIGGITELVKDNYNGFLFEAGNIESLFSIITTLLKSHDDFNELSKNAIDSSIKFTLNEQITKTLNVYDELIRNK